MIFRLQPGACHAPLLRVMHVRCQNGKLPCGDAVRLGMPAFCAACRESAGQKGKKPVWRVQCPAHDGRSPRTGRSRKGLCGSGTSCLDGGTAAGDGQACAWRQRRTLLDLSPVLRKALRTRSFGRLSLRRKNGRQIAFVPIATRKAPENIPATGTHRRPRLPLFAAGPRGRSTEGQGARRPRKMLDRALIRGFRHRKGPSHVLAFDRASSIRSRGCRLARLSGDATRTPRMVGSGTGWQTASPAGRQLN